MANRKPRRRGPIYNLPEEALSKLRDLCDSSTPFHEIAAWLGETHGLKVSHSIVSNWWYKAGRNMPRPPRSDRSRSSVTVGSFTVTIKAPGPDRLEIHVSPR